MAKQLIEVDGREVMVREDVAKAYRGVNWMAVVMALFILIVAFFAVTFLLTASSDGDVTTPVDLERSR